MNDEQVARYRQVLKTHANNAGTGGCKVCGRPRCRDWLDAFDRLAEASKTMAEPDQWLTDVPGPWGSAR